MQSETILTELKGGAKESKTTSGYNNNRNPKGQRSTRCMNICPEIISFPCDTKPLGFGLVYLFVKGFGFLCVIAGK